MAIKKYHLNGCHLFTVVQNNMLLNTVVHVDVAKLIAELIHSKSKDIW